MDANTRAEDTSSRKPHPLIRLLTSRALAVGVNVLLALLFVGALVGTVADQ